MLNFLNRLCLSSLITLVCSSLLAENNGQKINQVEALKFVDFYFQGTEPLLLEMKLCRAVEDRTCIQELEQNKLPVNKTIYSFMVFTLPLGLKQAEVSLRVTNSDGKEVDSATTQVKQSLRYRTWKSFRLKEAGSYKLKISSQANSANYQHLHLNMQAE